MEQHPVPQQISSYQFRLVGDMTLKQFFQLAGGALIALLVYSSPLPSIFKWPLVVFFALSGAAFAFLPFEERPLEVWVLAFFRSIYSPTLFYWKKYDKPPVYFVPDSASPSVASLPDVTDVTPTQTTNAGSETGAILSKLEVEESNFMSKVGNLFKAPHAAPVNTTVNTGAQVQAQVIPPPQLPQVKPEIKPIQEVYKAPEPAIDNGPLPAPQVQAVGQTLPGQNMPAAHLAQFSVDAAPPTPADKPNIIVGQVMDSAGKIVEGAILEVRDEQNRPVRALKTNRAGHFLIVTPLGNGKYQLVVEKQDLEFDPITFDAVGQIIPAIAIKAK